MLVGNAWFRYVEVTLDVGVRIIRKTFFCSPVYITAPQSTPNLIPFIQAPTSYR